MIGRGLILMLVVVLGNPFPALVIDKAAPHPDTGNGRSPGQGKAILDAFAADPYG
jgi:hypothetical protein